MKAYLVKVAALFALCVSVSFAAVCNNATIKGSYAVLGYGVIGAADYNVVRTSVFDGKGNFTGAGWMINDGVGKAFSNTGTYTVAKDCSVTINVNSVTGPLTQFGLLVDGGKKIFAIRQDDGQNVTLIYEKQQSSPVTAQ